MKIIPHATPKTGRKLYISFLLEEYLQKKLSDQEKQYFLGHKVTQPKSIEHYDIYKEKPEKIKELKD